MTNLLIELKRVLHCDKCIKSVRSETIKLQKEKEEIEQKYNALELQNQQIKQEFNALQLKLE